VNVDPRSELGHKTWDIWVIEQNGEDWLEFGKSVFVVLVGTSCDWGGTWDIVLVEPLLQIEHLRHHSRGRSGNFFKRGNLLAFSIIFVSRRRLSFYLSLDFVCGREWHLQYLIGSSRSARTGTCDDVREDGQGTLSSGGIFCLSDHFRLKEKVVFVSESRLCM
jgi:hypothetical protein